MNKTQIESYLLVAVQFACAVFFFYFVLSTPLSLLSIFLITLAIANALWSIFTMHIGNFRLQPIPKDEAKLITTGPYRFMRHPMYGSVLIGMLGIAISMDTWFGYTVWTVLFVDLLIKLRFEEKLLLERFSEYKEYIKRTKKLLPFL
jgi:protein-S-isoprenylcysteine O-methyltransferase Ste14